MAKKKGSSSFFQHLQSLGFYTVDAYLAWCRTHGFEAKIHKSRVQVSREVAQVEDRKLRAILAGKRPDTRIEVRKLGAVRARKPRQDWLAGLRPHLDGTLTLRQLGETLIGNRAKVWGRLPGAWQTVLQTEIGVLESQALADLLDAVGVRSRPLLDGQLMVGGRHLDYATGLLNLAIRRRQWLRPLARWPVPSHDHRSQFASLANHLLAEYPVPEFMATAWLRDDHAGFAWRDLFLHVGRGNNPRTGKTPVPLTRRMAHHFLHAPAHCSTEEAIRWGQITALGGTQQLADACVATQLGEHFRNDAFWLSVIRWFIAHPTFDPGQVGPAVDFIRHVKFERTRIQGVYGEYEFPPPPQPGFSMTGRTPDALLRQMERWHATLHRNSTAAKANVETWPTCGIRGLRRQTPIRGIGAGWTIEELLSAGNLEREGCERVARCAIAFPTNPYAVPPGTAPSGASGAQSVTLSRNGGPSK